MDTSLAEAISTLAPADLDRSLVRLAARIGPPPLPMSALDGALLDKLESIASIRENATGRSVSAPALLLLLSDASRCGEVHDQIESLRNSPSQRFMGQDPVLTASLISAALVVLSTHVEFTLVDGKWSLKVIKQPADAAVLRDFIQAVTAAARNYLNQNHDPPRT